MFRLWYYVKQNYEYDGDDLLYLDDITSLFYYEHDVKVFDSNAYATLFCINFSIVR